jgi:quinol monooxygenase YgiN
VRSAPVSGRLRHGDLHSLPSARRSGSGCGPGGMRVGRFAQHTRLVATRGNADRLAQKFLESVEMQRDNPACTLMIVSRSPDDDDAVFLTEVWSSESEWERARHSPVVDEWAKDMPLLVAEAPQSVRLDPLGGKGLP